MLKQEYEALKKELINLNNEVVFAHNDLLLGNVLYNEKEMSVTFIDFEYTGYNYQAYDIANHFAEFAGNLSICSNIILQMIFFYNIICIIKIYFHL